MLERRQAPRDGFVEEAALRGEEDDVAVPSLDLADRGRDTTAVSGSTPLLTSGLLDSIDVLNLVLLALMALMGWRFLRTGGLEMLRMMEMPPANDVNAADSHHHHHQH